MAEIIFDMQQNGDKVRRLREFIASHREQKGALMPVLQEAQIVFGYLPEKILGIISKEMGVPIAEIYGVATFYAQFTFVPKGRHDINVCLGTACYVKGAENLIGVLEEELGIKAGETTPDLRFSISPCRCLGACGNAPVMAIDGVQYGHLDSREKVIETLDIYRRS